MSETASTLRVGQLASEFMDYLNEKARPDAEVEAAVVAVWLDDGTCYWRTDLEPTEVDEISDAADVLQLALDLAQAALDTEVEEEAEPR